MWVSLAVVSSLVAMATCANNEYLPPNSGYTYDKPSIPFPSGNNGNKQPPFRQPTQPTYRPTQRPIYVPPPGPEGHDHEHEHHDHHNHDHDHHHHENGGEHDHHHHHEPGMPFDFAYSVNEDGNDYSHNAISDGDVTTGEYRVALPDGRTQIVKYTADWKNGFNAEVSYEGEARYPDQAGYGSGNGGQAYGPPSQGGGYQY
ncbi:hypothetical protein O3G_MSEX012456 [Manduca sexta]|uniref:Cuticle protein n=2 Tax=Manduca sexta TaxID=7130 RepID=A0A922CVK7_MANSE|nr:hypothetical protein O3G_MSEX012456 [Manduca sexta]KAG6461165.1 hypothetical protein O3G_MSEX012456 [Manduca sexta]